MTEQAKKETHEFQTEVTQLLQLMIHSLYSNKEIFLRELISNASDACDRLRFLALSDESLYEGDGDLHVRIELDKDARTLTIHDNGIGMDRQEVMDNIGTIAKSGTRAFFESLTGDQAKDARLIGQFGVGFYSSFIVADRVTLTTRRAGRQSGEGVRWESDGSGSYTLETVERADRGTSITLHLREGEDDLLEPFRIQGIVHKYSEHISLPIQMHPADEESKAEWETINQASALWARPRKEISEDEYKAFYKHVAHDFEDPLIWTHNHVEGNQSYTSLLYVPKRAPFDLWEREHRRGIKLYVKRVFIMDDAEHLMPHYLRFVRGLVDSDDLPLNVSREILQHNKAIDSIRAASVKKVLGLLEGLAKDEPETYAAFWDEFGEVLKEGPAEDYANRERIAGLLRFASTRDDSPAQRVSLADYVSRMQDGQEKIYYITAESHNAAKSSPHLEVFRAKGIEVLLLSDRIDEWLVSHLTEFDGRPLVSVAKGDLDLGKLDEGDEDKAESKEGAEAEADKAHAELTERLGKVLGGRVAAVKVSHRLVDSPACLVREEHEMAPHMARLLRQAGHEVPQSRPTLEINPSHALVRRLEAEADEAGFADWAELVLGQAVLAEGGQLDDPAGFVQRLNRLFLGGDLAASDDAA